LLTIKLLENSMISKNNHYLLLTLLSTSIMSCSENIKSINTQIQTADFDLSSYSQADFDYLAINDPTKLSAASKRALERNYHKNADWFGRFHKSPVTGDLAFEEGVTRRDPSKVLLVNGVYYTWYSKTEGPSYGFGTGDPEKKVFPWDKTELWYATSTDGIDWKEQGLAVGRGEKGRFDDRSVFTPEVLAHNGKYYLVYQTVKAPYLNRTQNEVGMAIADSPDGPWTKLDKPILKAATNGVWSGTEDDHFKAKVQGDFDSHKVHDPTLMFFNNKFYLYYKGERFGEKKTMGGREIRWGVAMADNPEGPYTKSEFNPITHSGHELAIWHYRDGIAFASCKDGPENGTFQYSTDGINFEIMAYVKNIPDAIATVESLDNDAYPGAALSWGLSHEYYIPKGKQWYEGYNYISRFTFKNNQPKN
jgi:hypothetical protein